MSQQTTEVCPDGHQWHEVVDGEICAVCLTRRPALPPDLSSGAEAMLKARDLEIERLRAVLQEIAAVRYGAELTDSPEELIEYWSEMCRRYRRIAKRALDGA